MTDPKDELPRREAPRRGPLSPAMLKALRAWRATFKPSERGLADLCHELGNLERRTVTSALAGESVTNGTRGTIELGLQRWEEAKRK